MLAFSACPTMRTQRLWAIAFNTCQRVPNQHPPLRSDAIFASVLPSCSLGKASAAWRAQIIAVEVEQCRYWTCRHWPAWPSSVSATAHTHCGRRPNIKQQYVNGSAFDRRARMSPDSHNITAVAKKAPDHAAPWPTTQHVGIVLVKVCASHSDMASSPCGRY